MFALILSFSFGLRGIQVFYLHHFQHLQGDFLVLLLAANYLADVSLYDITGLHTFVSMLIHLLQSTIKYLKPKLFYKSELEKVIFVLGGHYA